MKTASKAGRTPKHRFGRDNQVVVCRCCGKRTTEAAGGNYGLELCARCAEDAGLENELCPLCRAAAVAS